MLHPRSAQKPSAAPSDLQLRWTLSILPDNLLEGTSSSLIERAVVAALTGQIRHSCDTEAFAAIAYCFMPDHLHLLAEGTQPDSDLRRFMKTFKQRSAYAWKQQGGDDLWQRSYFDHVLREEEDTFKVARYILDNPVRAGLVTRPQDYPFSGSLVMDVHDLLWSL